MEKLFNYIGKIATIISIIGGCVAIYFAFHEKEVKLDIQTICAEHLTTNAPQPGLSVKYYYNDTLEVYNLWKMQWVIRNTGEKTIIGTGNNSQLLTPSLPLNFDQSVNILSINITNSNNNAVLKNGHIWFQQWRKGEYIEVTAFIESVKCPTLAINDRDLIDSEISYSEYTPDATIGKKSIVEYLPHWCNNTLQVIYYIIVTLIFITCLILLFTSNNDKSTKIAAVILLLFMLIPLLWLIRI